MVARSGERIAIVGRFDVENVERTGGYTTVVGYDQSIREPLLEHLTRIAPQTVALNYSESDPASDGLTYGMFRVLAHIVGGTEYASRLVSAEGVINALRGRKSPREVTRIRASIAATQELYREVNDFLKPGLSEVEIARFVHDRIAARGWQEAWEQEYCPVVAAGPDSPIGHAMPAQFTAQRGHLLQMDFGVKKDGFVGDLQRTWYFLEEGETGLPSEVAAGWKAARAALEAGRAALRPGARGWEVDAAARLALTEAGYPEYPHAFGHHIGRTAHDGATILGPRWERYGTSVEGKVEVSNVFAIEVGVRVPGRGYIGCEEDVLVTEAGAEYLSELQTEIWCI